MPEVTFVLAPGQNAFFVELASAMRHELRSLGVQSSLATGDFPDPKPDLVYVLVPPHEYAQLRGGKLPRHLLGRTIFICAEQPESRWFGSNLPLTRLGASVFDVNLASVRRLRELGIRADHLPLGYTSLWDRFDPDSGRDLDFLFYASATRRRERILAGWARSLWRHRSHLVISDNLQPNTSTSESFLAGEDKRRLLARARVVLNLHRSEEPYFEWQRVLEAIHCGAVVVTEPSTDYHPLVPGEHFLSGNAQTMHLIAEELLEDEGRRESMASSAYELIRERLPLARSAERLATEAERVASSPSGLARGRALLGRSTPLGHEPTLGTVLRPLRDLVEAPVRRSARARKEAKLAAIARARREARAQSAIPGDGAPALIESSTQTSAYRASEPPTVSVVTALYNQADYVGAALDSVDRGRFRDFELVVVDDGSTDRSRAVVEEWMRDHDSVPAALLRHPANHGLPATRDAAIDVARGEHVLVLDADNQLYPHCLERLVGALDADPGAAFAYGILETFDARGPIGLIGFLGWDPERLRRHNYIDALALIRRSALREVGGFTTDLRLYGWEDYDLWCKLAVRGMRAVHVKEIVARYRVSEGSMISLTNLSLEGALEALAERHPELFERVGTETPS
jgi:Glycosyl transferase family 2/Glycosyl transferases group 1